MVSLGVIRHKALLFLTIVDKFGTFSTIWTPLRKFTLSSNFFSRVCESVCNVFEGCAPDPYPDALCHVCQIIDPE